MPHHEPTGGYRQAIRVLRAEIVRVRMIRQAEWAQGSHLIAVVVGERRHGFSRAADLRAESCVHSRQVTGPFPRGKDAAPPGPADSA